MIWAGCFAALLALALVGHIRMSVRGEYTKTSVGLWLCVGRIQYRLYPKGKKKLSKNFENVEDLFEDLDH